MSCDTYSSKKAKEMEKFRKVILPQYISYLENLEKEEKLAKIRRKWYDLYYGK